MKKIVVVGSGINGLVAANYLVKEGYDVTIIEKKDSTGGACIKDSIQIENKKIDFAYGATVLGMMPDFIFIISKITYSSFFIPFFSKFLL